MRSTLFVTHCSSAEKFRTKFLRATNYYIPKELFMETKHYILTDIEGEYAYLTDTESGERVFISLMLLPLGADVGSRIKCEGFEYSEE